MSSDVAEGWPEDVKVRPLDAEEAAVAVLAIDGLLAMLVPLARAMSHGPRQVDAARRVGQLQRARRCLLAQAEALRCEPVEQGGSSDEGR